MRLYNILVTLLSTLSRSFAWNGLNYTGQDLWVNGGTLTEIPPGGFSTRLAVTPPDVVLNLQPKIMWGWGINSSPGFCGEASFQVAAQYFGSYFSQGVIHDVAGDELLIGVNDKIAAQKLGLKYETLDPPSPTTILPFIQSHTRMGHVVLAGMYITQRHGKGESEYDHIAPILGSVRNDGKQPDTVAYTDLATDRIRLLEGSKIIMTRSQATSRLRTAQYTDNKYSISDGGYVGAVSGVADLKSQLVRTRIVTNSSSEPDWSEESKLNQEPAPLKISLYVYGLVCGLQYKVFRYDGLTAPSADFHLQNFAKVFAFNATGPDIALIDHDVVPSNGTYHYRTVQLNN